MDYDIDNNPCASCPYRKNVPSGVWDAEEYAKLPNYDGETFEQAHGVFICHNGGGIDDNSKLCRGWTDCHDGNHLLALRIAQMEGSQLPDGAFEKSSTDVFDSGFDAYAHGMTGVDDPDEKAQRLIDSLQTKRAQK